MSNTVCILSTEYFPPISSFWLMNNIDATYLEHHENYQKKSYRNRTRILGNNKIIPLSVPLKKGKNSQSLITSTEISYDENWIKDHIQTLKTYYGSAPFYEYYIPEIEEILIRQYALLMDLNSAIVDYIRYCFQIEKQLIPTSSFVKDYGDNNMDFRFCGIKAREIPKYQPLPYYQLTSDNEFHPDLSILDLLFNKGPEGVHWLC